MTRLGELISESGSTGSFYVATTSGHVTDAINDIKSHIKEKIYGYSSVEINDGITPLTQTVEKTGMADSLPDSDDYEYYKGHKATQDDVTAGRASSVGETIWEPWTTAEMDAAGVGRASYINGAVKWNLGETFMLEDGVSYKVDFTVWPSQKAYDILADINNSCIRDETTGELTTYPSPDAAYNNLPQDIRNQIYKDNGVYKLKTNLDSAGFSYKKATMEVGGSTVTPNGNPIPGTFDPVIPLELRTDKIGVKKSFSNLLDSRNPTTIQMELWGDRLYKSLTLSADADWESNDNYISCGLLTVDTNSRTVYIYETGHDFTLKETGDDSIYWELTADTYHPMVINNVLHMLSKVDESVDMEGKNYKKEDSKEYYKIGDNVYLDEETDAVLNAVNDHRSFLDLIKAVVDENGNSVECNDYFNFNVKINDSRAGDDVIFTVYDAATSTYISDQTITTATLTPANDGTTSRPYYSVANSTEFTLKIKQGWNVRFLNLSNDSTYTIEEVLGDDSEYEFKKIDGSALKTENNIPTSADNGMTITAGQTNMSGTIKEPNVQYTVKYSNGVLKKKVKVYKTNQDASFPLPGAVFDLYGDDYISDGVVNVTAMKIKTNLQSDSVGIIDLGELVYGTYYLVETKAPNGYIKSSPITIVVASNAVTYIQEENTLASNGSGVIEASGTYTLTVVNDEGVELPATGGITTTPIYLLGLLLTTYAAISLLLKQRANNL